MATVAATTGVTYELGPGWLAPALIAVGLVAVLAIIAGVISLIFDRPKKPPL